MNAFQAIRRTENILVKLAAKLDEREEAHASIRVLDALRDTRRARLALRGECRPSIRKCGRA